MRAPSPPRSRSLLDNSSSRPPPSLGTPQDSSHACHRRVAGTRRTLLGMDVGAPEALILLVVVMLLFGAKKLPELARGSGRALRIFKEELNGSDEATPTTPTPAAPSES